MSNTYQSFTSNGFGFQMPEILEVDLETYTSTYGKFTLQPLERGYGITIGNSFRRVLLSSLPGAAITTIRIPGIPHEFSTIKGVKEDVIDIVLNLRQVRLKMLTRKVERLKLHLRGPMKFTARELQNASREFEIINPDLHIATLNEDAEFDFEFTAQQGRGYVPAEENRDPDAPIGTIPLDALFNPVRKVNFAVENT
ncbi:MAG: DNA-directed RNA polymerase subunit alpha, partial [bacterium]